MKASTKALIAFIIIAVIATGIAVGGAFLEKEYVIDLAKSIIDPSYGYTTLEYKEEEGQVINNLNIKVKYGRVEIKTGDAFSIVARTKKTKVNIGYDNGTYNYSDTDVKNWFNNSRNSYVVTVPKDRTVSLNAESVAGNIYLTDYENGGDVKLSSTGSIELSNAKVAKLTIESQSGDVDIKNAKVVSLNVANMSGDNEIADVVAAGEVTVTAKSGTVEINRVTAANIKAESISGEVNVGGAVAEALQIKAVSGDIMIKNCKILRFDLQSTSGDVIIELDNQKYNFDARCTSGSIEYDGKKIGNPYIVQDDSTAGMVKVKTVSGSIEIYTKELN